MKRSKATFGDFYPKARNIDDLIKEPRALDIMIYILDKARPITIKERTKRLLIRETDDNGFYIDNELAKLEQLDLIKVDWKEFKKSEEPLRYRNYVFRIVDKEGVKQLQKIANGEQSSLEMFGLKSVAKLISSVIFEDKYDALEFFVDCGANEKTLIDLCEGNTSQMQFIFGALKIYSTLKDDFVINNVIKKICEIEFIKKDKQASKELEGKINFILSSYKKVQEKGQIQYGNGVLDFLGHKIDFNSRPKLQKEILDHIFQDDKPERYFYYDEILEMWDPAVKTLRDENNKYPRKQKRRPHDNALKINKKTEEITGYELLESKPSRMRITPIFAERIVSVKH